MQRQCEERLLVYTYLDPSFYLAHRFLACVGLVHADDEVYELHRINLSLHLNCNNYFCDERQNAAGATTAISDKMLNSK
jgi:protein involved in sex pheromone biosynthesis